MISDELYAATCELDRMLADRGSAPYRRLNYAASGMLSGAVGTIRRLRLGTRVGQSELNRFRMQVRNLRGMAAETNGSLDKQLKQQVAKVMGLLNLDEAIPSVEPRVL